MSVGVDGRCGVGVGGRCGVTVSTIVEFDVERESDADQAIQPEVGDEEERAGEEDQHALVEGDALVRQTQVADFLRQRYVQQALNDTHSREREREERETEREREMKGREEREGY